MNKVLRLVGNSYIRSLKLGCLSSTSKNISEMKKNKTSVQDNFIQYAYGMESQFHFLPKRLKRKMEIPEENYKFYKKYSPNYLVILVRKVLQENSFFKQFNKADVNNNLTKEANKVDGKEPEIVENHLDKFYHTCAFCQVQYLPNNQIQLQGLFNVRIRDIKQVEASEAANVENLSNPHPIITSVSQKQEKQENDEITEPNIFTQNMDEREIRGEGKKKIPSIYSITKRSLRRNSKNGQKSQRYWWVKAQKIIQPPLILTSQIELKFKYLIQRYIQMNNYTLGRFEPLFNTVDIVQMLDSIAGQCIRFNVDKSSLQRYIEATEYETKIDELIEITNNILHLNQHFSIIENEAKNVIRNKKLYQYYSEVMKVSKHILEGNKAKHIFIEKCKKRFYQMNPPKEVEKVFELEVERFRQLDSNQMESATVKAYIQELSKIPYNVQSQQIFDVEYAQKVLNQQHYGMKDVKDAILQIIASGQLKKQLKGKIFCFIGGPGIGKTSFAKSVAKALNRKFYNISLGGASDSSVLKGHRRTYVGAYSGKIIEALRNCGTNNPVILLDQIDKMGNSYHGDPRAQLLQILDPNQNNAFVDLYLDVPVDLSNVLFITTANYERNISRPLLNRMQKIYLTNYSKEEKIEIFNRHLLKRAIQSTGVKADQFELPQQVVEALVEQYSLRQPGVRFLQKSALKILQKIAYKIVSKQQQAPVKISKQSLRNYLGNSYFRRKDHNNLGKGLAISLGGGGYDSRLTYIEAFRTSFVSRKQINRGTLFTGSLSQVFKEAMNISYTYARNFLLQKYNNRFLFQNQVHVHAPEGGFKKDGSTDSLTIVSALVSLSLDTKVKEGVAMTGQITLNGHLLRTEGIKQKIMVANRERIREVVLPKDNEPDVQNLSKDIKQGIKFHYVSNFSEAFAYLFPEKVQKNVEIQG